MAALHQVQPTVSPHLIAGLILAALEHLVAQNLPCPTATQVLKALGVGRTQAYAQRMRVMEALAGLQRPPGRPPAPSPAATVTASTQGLSLEVLRFVLAHPGCAAAGAARQQYSDTFRRFILELRSRNAELDLATFAQATAIPAGTIEDWLRTAPPKPPPPQPAAPTVTIPQLETLVEAWKSWTGTFMAFCKHAQENLHIPHGANWIASILEATGARKPKRRRGRSPDEEALRNAFETFFPGAQWVGDGTPIDLRINDKIYCFNLELMVDAHSGARTGMSIRDEEDAAAVVDAVNDGVETTGAPPLAVLLDNRPSNHAPEVVDGLVDIGDVLKIRATPGRAQNKGHVEGSFGLFRQVAPELAIDAQNEGELAREILRLVTTTWARATNHLPRADRNGRSRVQLYEDKPTPEQVEQAKKALRERYRQQELQEERRRARLSPVTRKMLDDAFARLGLADPDHHFRNALAAYPLDAVLAGIATFEGKQNAGRLPDGVDARYLLGIVRNISQEREGLAIGEALLRARLAARDAALRPLLIELSEINRNPVEAIDRLIDRAIASDRHIDRLFWLQAAGEAIRTRPMELRPNLVRRALRQINTTHHVPFGERLTAVRILQEAAIPIEMPAVDAELKKSTPRPEDSCTAAERA